MDQSENWKTIVGFDEYEVSDLGRVRRAGRLLRAHASRKKPYLVVGLCKDGKRHPFAIHRLVMDAFIGLLPTGFDRSHIDGNEKNNAASNLVFEVHVDNNRRKIEHGTDPAGERNPNPKKITGADVAGIMEAASRGLKQSQIMKKFKVSRATVYRVLSGRHYRHANQGAPQAVSIAPPQPQPKGQF